MASSPKARSRLPSDPTLCIHAGEERHGRKGPITTEIIQSSVFVFPTLNDLRRYQQGKDKSYIYTRYANPTTEAAEKKIAALEGAEDCVVTSSGMAAELVAVLAACRAGDDIVSMLDLYGGTAMLFERILPRFGVRCRFVPFTDLGRIERYFTRRTRLLFLESPTNPTLRIADLERLAAAAGKRRITVAVDNTFATPILQKPLALGADLVVHSATKYLGGHSDVTAGALAGRRPLVAAAREMVKYAGTPLDPGAAYLLIRGLKTLHLRVERACANAQQIAAALCAHPRVGRVMYPGLPGHAGHDVARRQMRDFGMMLAFRIRGGLRAAERFIDALRLWYLAPSLGGVESTVSYPLLSSHVGLPRRRLKLLDVDESTIRLSVGIEDADDLIADLNQALAAT